MWQKTDPIRETMRNDNKINSAARIQVLRGTGNAHTNLSTLSPAFGCWHFADVQPVVVGYQGTFCQCLVAEQKLYK